MTALIELACRAHLQPDGQGPLVTIVDGIWAYCAERASGDHEWLRIPPTTRELLEDPSQAGGRAAS